MPTVTPRKGRTTAPAATTTASTTAATTPVVTPTATINTMIVCLPDGLPSQALTATQLDRHIGVPGTLQPSGPPRTFDVLPAMNGHGFLPLHPRLRFDGDEVVVEWENDDGLGRPLGRA